MIQMGFGIIADVLGDGDSDEEENSNIKYYYSLDFRYINELDY